MIFSLLKELKWWKYSIQNVGFFIKSKKTLILKKRKTMSRNWRGIRRKRRKRLNRRGRRKRGRNEKKMDTAFDTTDPARFCKSWRWQYPFDPYLYLLLTFSTRKRKQELNLYKNGSFFRDCSCEIFKGFHALQLDYISRLVRLGKNIFLWLFIYSLCFSILKRFKNQRSFIFKMKILLFMRISELNLWSFFSWCFFPLQSC